MQEKTTTDPNEIQAYAYTDPHNTFGYAIGRTHEELIDFLMDREDLDTPDDAIKFIEQEQLTLHEIKGIPIKDIIEIPNRTIFASGITISDTVKNAMIMSRQRNEILNQESMAEIVANEINENNEPHPDPEKATSILSTYFGENVKVTYDLKDGGRENKKLMKFSDGSELDMRGKHVVAISNQSQRLLKLERQYRAEFGVRLKSDVTFMVGPDNSFTNKANTGHRLSR